MLYMAKDLLTAKSWKSLSKEHKYPDDKLMAALEAYEDIADGEDYAAQVTALEKLGELLYSLGKKKDLPDEIEEYARKVEKEIKGPLAGAKEGVRLEASMSRTRTPPAPKDEAEGEDEGDGTLEGALKIIKTRADNVEKALSFVACVGKPYALAFAKRIGNKHKKAVKAKTGGTKLWEGKCIFEAGAYTFIVDAAPPRGLSKLLKAGMYAECGKNHKVRVRDLAGTTVLDDETDELAPEDRPVQATPAGTPVEPVAGVKVSEAAAKIKLQVEVEKFTKRLATLIKTVTVGIRQAPDEAVRILTNVETELDLKVATFKAKDKDVVLPSAAAVLKERIVAGKAAVVAKASEITQGHAKAWLKQLNPLVAEGPVDNKKLIEAITGVEEGLKLDRAMLGRLKQPAPVFFAAIDGQIVKARQKYLASFPQRKLAIDPTDPPKANRPAIGDLGKKFTDVVDKSEAAMAKDEKPAVEDLRNMAAQIETKLPKNLEAELKATYKNWDGVKHHYKELLKTNKKAGDDFMSAYWWFRRKVVDETMANLQEKYDFNWASVGSANLESDYDISIKTHGTFGGKIVYDYTIVTEFNKTISKRFGSQPGTLFDTNLYASAAVPEPVADPTLSPEKAQVVSDMKALAEAGQDVGALMKMRRYMDWESFESYKEGILAEITADIGRAENQKDKVAVAKRLQATRRQFEEADDLYFMAIYKQLTKAGKTPPQDLSPEGQKQLLAMAEELEHHGDELMETNNDLYVEAMEEVRTIEQALKDASPADTEKKNALFSKLKTAQADATFFAAEAYHSEGPFKHIVEARQSSDARVKNGEEYAGLTPEQKAAAVKELTEAAIRRMSVTQMMQSFNENLGDLLKDLKHYADKSDLPALGFYRSSKYFERLCDAMEIIGTKLEGKVADDFKGITIAEKSPTQMKAALAKLVKVRGGAGFAADAVDDPEKEKEAFVIAEMAKALPAVATLKDLAATVTAAGTRVNAILRKAAAGEAMIAKSENAYFAAS